MNILTFFAGREDNGDLYLFRHQPVWTGEVWRNSPKNKFEDEIYIGSIDVLPEIATLPHKPKRVTMALAKGRVEELELSILRRVAENYGGRTIENIIQNYEQIIKERDENNKKKYVQETHI